MLTMPGHRLYSHFLTPDVLRQEYTELGKSSLVIGEQFGISSAVIRDHLKRYGIERRSISDAKRRYPEIDVSPFRNIQSPEIAYWLGFILADGCVHQSPRRQFVSIRLAAKDREHIDAFRKTARITNPIYDSVAQNPTAGITIHSSDFIAVLGKYGVMPHKDFRTRFPSALSPKLWPAFIRGYFDGDGTVYLRHRVAPNTRWTEPVCRFISGSPMFLNQLRDILNQAGIVTIKRYRNQRSNAYVLPLSGKRDNIRRFYDYIYAQPGDFLSRKRSVFEEYLNPCQ